MDKGKDSVWTLDAVSSWLLTATTKFAGVGPLCQSCHNKIKRCRWWNKHNKQTAFLEKAIICAVFEDPGVLYCTMLRPETPE